MTKKSTEDASTDQALDAMPISEFCKRYSICRTKVYDELKRGRLKAKKCGRLTLISRTAAEHWFQALADYSPKSRGNNRQTF